MNRSAAKVIADIRAFALGLPGAEEKTPWGESVARVKKGIFVYFGRSDAEKAAASEAKQAHVGRPGDYSLNLKLPHSGARLIREGRGRPSDYGLGKKGWVVVTYPANAPVDIEEVRSLIVESYRAVAPPTLARQLDTAGLSEERRPTQRRKRRNQPGRKR